LYERLLPDTVQWGARLQDYTENADGVELRFQDGSTLNCSMLVGADGIHSFVRRLQDTKCNEKVAPLRYLGVAAIIGLSPAMHPLLDAQGFYTMGPRARLFTMPFRPAVLAADGSGRVEQPPLTMWQLSFAEEDEAKARALKASPPEDLLAHALQRTSGWMAPVLELLSASPLANVWAIALYDRDARRLRTKQQASRVTVVGDACHPMSMFKGQGANQSLQDGPLLAKVLTLVDKNTPASLLDAAGRPLLTREALLNRVRRFEAQMVQRAAHRVLASREAARALHAPEASLLTPACGELYGIGGVNLSVEQTTRVLVRASEKKIGAPLADQLDSVFAQLLDETVPRDQRVAAKSKANCGMAANDM
jgi:2-polyprenyl-6-methoxyphenol hydroxylase-like FAD-dependent oxidoreductase